MRPYSWVEEHCTHDAPDRRIRRLLEADNRKKREVAKKERNEEIRVSVLTCQCCCLLCILLSCH